MKNDFNIMRASMYIMCDSIIMCIVIGESVNENKREFCTRVRQATGVLYRVWRITEQAAKYE